MEDTTLVPNRPKVAPQDKVPLVQKVAYGIGTTNDMWGNWLYVTMVWPVFQIYLGVPGKVISTVLALRLIIDAAADPIFGWLSDNTRTRWGRRRPYILVGSIVSGLTLPLLFAAQPGWSNATYFWFMLATSAVFMTFVSSFNMPYQSLGAELTPDYNERTMLFSFKSGIQKLPEVAMFFAATFITLEWWNDPETGQPDMLRGALAYTIILGAVMVVVGIIVSTVVKERYYETVVRRKQDRISILDTIWKALRCQPFRAQLTMGISYNMGTCMVGTLGYYVTVYHVCGGDVVLGSRWNFAMGLSNLGIGLLGIPFYAWIARTFGKRDAMKAVIILAVIVFVSTWWLYNPAIPVLQIFASGFIAFNAAGFWMLYGAMGPDVIDSDELDHGQRREGAFAACGTWIMKLGIVLGTLATGFVLDGTGFDSAKGPDQAEETLVSMRLWLAALPIVGLAVAAFGLSRFRLTGERVSQIRGELEARRGSV